MKGFFNIRPLPYKPKLTWDVSKVLKGLGAIRAKIGPTSDVDKMLASEHVFIPEINPHRILSQIYVVFIEFIMLCFCFCFLKIYVV
jgi:hypothetical protein